MTVQTVEFLTMLCKFAYPFLNMWIFLGVVQQKEETYSYSQIFWPIIFVGFITYFSCLFFIDLYNEIMVSLTLSLAADMELNNGLPRFGPTIIHNKLDYVYNFHHKLLVAFENE